MDEFEKELKEGFLDEASDLLSKAESLFLNLEKSAEDKSLLDHIFRLAHNLKGTSRAVGFGQMAELTHKAENLILKIKQGEIVVNPYIVSVLLAFNDRLNEMIVSLKADLSANFDNKDIEDRLEAALTGKNVETKPVEVKNEERKNGDEVIVEQDLVTTSSTPIVKSAEKKEVKTENKKDDETIRVSLNRLEKLNDLVGELVILQTLVETNLSSNGDNKVARSLAKLSKEIQDLTLSLRMVQVGPTFQKLSRIVRDTSKQLNKKIDLQLVGEETEIDKTVAESIGDPLVHIIRNAIDHGVETPDVRKKIGKKEEGTVEVVAFHEGNFLIIQITDDGNGINGKVLIEKAKKKGIIPQDANLSEQQGIELIFHPGFSTKDQVSEVSGRGVGMDVVKTNIENLGGVVKVQSQVGVGSCFRLMLPLTLAIIEGMLIESSDQKMIIPKSQVQEITKLDREKISSGSGRATYFSLRDQVIPLFNLSNEVGHKLNSLSEIAVIVKHGEQLFAVGVTDVIRQQQVVVKPPTKEIMGRMGVMGTTILGDGKPSLIIDLINLYGQKVKKDKIKIAA